MHALTGLGVAGLAACSAPLLPNERVIEVDVPAERFEGAEGARLGEVVAWSDDGWLATAPGAAEVWRNGAAEDASAAFAGWWDGGVLLVDAEGRFTLDGALVVEERSASTWAVGADGLAIATSAGVVLVPAPGEPARTFAVEGVRALAAEDGIPGWTALVCVRDACAARDLDADGVLGAERMTAPVDGVLARWQGRTWIGDAAYAGGAGRACAEDGTCLEGLEGDGLGAAFGGGRVAGTFNSRIVPPRARLVSLEGADTLALESGAELQPIALAGGDGALVVGAPYHAVGGAPGGVVWVVSP